MKGIRSSLAFLLALVLALGSVTAFGAAAPVYEPEYSTLNLNTGIALRYALVGDSANPAVVLIHGATDSYISYSQVAPILAEAGYAVYVPELRGHGGSDKPEEGPYTLDAHVQDIYAFIKAAGIATPYIAGHSLGSFVAQALVSKHGEELGVKGLALIGTAATTVGNPTLEWMLHGDEEFPGVGAFAEGVPEEFIAEWVMNGNEDAAFTEYTYAQALALPPYSWIHTFFGLENADNTALLGKIVCPVLILFGTEDSFFTEDDQHAVEAALVKSTGVELITYEGASHNTHWDAGMAEKVAADMIAFMEKTGE